VLVDLSNPERVATDIGIPLSKWEGNCFGVASALVETYDLGKAVYGMWTREMGTGLFAGRPFTHHGWVELPDGSIIDPTRYVFEDEAPYIYVGPRTPEYDPGSNRTRQIVREMLGTVAPPSWDETEPQYDFFAQVDPQTEDFVRTHLLLMGSGPTLSRAQMFWLANLDPTSLPAVTVRAIYRGLDAVKCRAAIPFDNQSWLSE